MWSHDVVSTSIGLAADLKMGQYLKIPPRTMFLTQVWGTILGKFYILYMSLLEFSYTETRGCGKLQWVHHLVAGLQQVEVYFNAVVMISIVTAQREILLSPTGTNIWSGQAVQSLNSAAVTWSLAKQLYGRGGPYFVIPLSLLIGMVPTFIQWLIWRVSNIKWATIMWGNLLTEYTSAGRKSGLLTSIRSISP